MVGDSNGHEQSGREICKLACTVEEGRWHPGASDVRSRMSEAGQDLFSRHGYGITLLQVIDQAGTPRGSIYYHFHDGKETRLNRWKQHLDNGGVGWDDHPGGRQR